MRLLVCGGREFKNKVGAFEFLDSLQTVTEICHGGARGADTIAGQWAELRGVPCMVYPVTKEQWELDGKAAGLFRNVRMFNDFKPDAVIAFPGGKGTAHMVRIAKESLRKTIVVETGDLF